VSSAAADLREHSQGETAARLRVAAPNRGEEDASEPASGAYYEFTIRHTRARAHVRSARLVDIRADIDKGNALTHFGAVAEELA
jgi:hypothetical protein